ncbi:PREDICTED: uncharacterized protein LOC101294047 [Fragaria vesca subsp. vesca]
MQSKCVRISSSSSKIIQFLVRDQPLPSLLLFRDQSFIALFCLLSHCSTASLSSDWNRAPSFNCSPLISLVPCIQNKWFRAIDCRLCGKLMIRTFFSFYFSRQFLPMAMIMNLTGSLENQRSTQNWGKQSQMECKFQLWINIGI